jgi:pyruvate/2-oxoglutarate dehydrogenase complex dihydrolipoamide dehydrogenase (E3) component
VELAQAFARLGSRVTIVSASAHVLPREDDDVAAVLARQLAAEGVTILDRARAVRAARCGGMKRVIVETPSGERTVDADEILVVAGRRPNVDDLGLEALGIAVDERAPEVARVGLSEAEALRRGVAYDVRIAAFEVLTRNGGDTILGAAIVHAHAGELLAELVLAKRHGLGLGKLSRPIHVYPTLGEANRAVGDAYLLGRLRPGARRALSAVFHWLRR